MASKDALDTTPYWSETPFPQFAKLSEDLRVDVVVVGAGMTGLNAAYLLAQAGKSVVVLERGRCASGDTGYTSAHLTSVTDTRLLDLVSRFGRTHAQAVWDAGFASIAQIEQIIRDEKIDAGFEWLEGYLYASEDDDEKAIDELKREAALAQELGFDAEFIDETPVIGVPGIRYEWQARIHPRRYLAGLAKAIVAKGGQIFEHSEACEFSADAMTVKANGHTVRFSDIVIATNNPVVGISGMMSAALFQTKLSLYSSYVVSGRVPKGVLPDALWWSTSSPYWYLRTEPHRDYDLVVFGGADHKTGQVSDTEECYDQVIGQLQAIVPAIEVTHRWSGQLIETPDGLPYIGATADHQYVATGYCGNGITFGMVGAMIITDTILGRKNPWSDLFDINRKALGRDLWEYVKENADYPYYMIRDRFAGAEGKSLRAVKRGQGKIIEHEGAKVAAYRDKDGAVTLLSAKCTHLGCIVAWNTAESTWDCPCHGSRFKATGEVISGPAESPLSEVE